MPALPLGFYVKETNINAEYICRRIMFTSMYRVPVSLSNCYVAQCCKWVRTFRRNILPTLSRMNKEVQVQHGAVKFRSNPFTTVATFLSRNVGK
jgi:hypothetical protein